MLYVSKAGKKGAVFLPKTVCQILKRYLKKNMEATIAGTSQKKGEKKEKKKVYSILSVTAESFE